LLASLLTQPFEFRRTARNPDAIAALSDLARQGAEQKRDIEVAAFLVQESDGTISCLRWPVSEETLIARFKGQIPPRVVAVAHTHPRWNPQPTRWDIDEARRTGLPIYVLTRYDVYVIDPSSGESIHVIERQNWTSRTSTQCKCKANWASDEHSQVGTSG
jgi:proteasome lid subunit RPN8/RPN11